MQDCSRCKCKLSTDNFERNSNGDLSTRCNKCRTQDKEYRQRVYQRRPTIAETNPDLLEEWDYEKNVGLRPDKLTQGSTKKVWWICKKDSHHKWGALIMRTLKIPSGCPICSNKLICPIDQCNSFGSIKNEDGELKYADLLKEVVYKEDMYKYTPFSDKKISWKCKNNSHHIWTASLSGRTGKREHACPICSNRIICPVDRCNSIGMIKNENGDLKYANLIEEFVCKKDMYKYTPSSHKKIYWKCKKDPHHIWEATISNRTIKRPGCPICLNQLICPIDQCNSIGMIKNDNGDLKYSGLIKEFACKEDVFIYTPSSNKKISWICKKDPHHTWEATIECRTGKKKCGCPICSNRIICPIDRCNSFGLSKNENGELKYADLLKELVYKEDMYKYTPSSDKKIYWNCKKIPAHKWLTSINHRTRKNANGCPICRESKGEKSVSIILQTNDINFITQKQKNMTVVNYSESRKLSIDFFGKIDNIKFAIEFDGKQHFDSESYYSKKGNYGDAKIRDWLKTQWCAENGVKLLRIHYRDLDNIQEIVTNFITNVGYAGILTLSSNPNGDYDFMIGDKCPVI